MRGWWLARFLVLSVLPLPLLISCGVKQEKIDYVKAVRSRTYYYPYDTYPEKDLAYKYVFFRGYDDYKFLVNLRGYRLKIVADYEFTLQKGGNMDEGQLLRIKVPRRLAYQFEGFNKIILTMKDGRLKVYDSDDYDINDYDGTLNNTTFAYSKNPRSINSRQFKVDVENAKKVSFAVRPGMFWSDYKGNKTKYRVKARDFLAYLLISKFLSYKGPLQKFGGSEELDSFWYKKTNSSRYSSSDLEPETYIYDLYGIDYNSILDYDLKGKNKPIESLMVEGKPIEVLSIFSNAASGVKGGLRLFLQLDNLSIGGGFILKAYPSSYNEELSRRSKDDKLGKGLVKRLRYYPYGVTIKDTLFAGRYMPVSDEIVGGKETIIYKKNPNFFDRKWVDSLDNIRKIVIERQKYQQVYDYHNIVYANLAQGQLLQIRPFFLEKTAFDKILKGDDPYIKKDQVKWDIASSSYSKMSVRFSPLILFSPFPSVAEDGKIDTSVYKFNDNFARFMYGADLKTIAEGKARTFMHFFGDDQISFRSLILSGVNWLQYAHYTNKGGGKGIYTYTLADLFGNLGGSDSRTAKIKTTYDGYELASSIYAIVNGKRAIEIPYKANVEGMRELRESDSFKGGGKVIYAKLQKAMTELLDRVYKQEGWDNKQKIAAEFIPYYLNPNENVILAQKNMVGALNNLDKKGRLAFTQSFISEGSLLRSLRVFPSGYHSISFNWGYDYEGNGSFLQGLLATGQSFIIPYVTEVLAKRDEKDPNNPFPLLTRLGKLFNEAKREGKIKLKPMRDLLNLTNEQYKDIHLNSKSALIQDPKLLDYNFVFAKFFFDIQDHFTNEEMIGLNKEVAVLYGWVNVEPLYVPADPNFGMRVIEQHGYNGVPVFVDSTFDPLPKEEQIFD